MLTDLSCRQARGRDKSYKLANARGLYLFVTPTGYRSWRWKYRFAGKETQLVLGAYPELGLNEARSRREDASRLLKTGVDPAIDRKRITLAQRQQVATTFEAVAREWFEHNAPMWVPVHASDVIKSLECDVFPAIGDLPITAVTSPMVLELI